MSPATIIVLLITAASPNITVAPKGNGYVAVVDNFDVTNEVAVEAEIDRRATELCTGRVVRWGKFGSSAKIDKKSSEVPQIADHYKEFSCVSVTPRSYAAAPADWHPSPADETEARAFFDRYYARRDGGDLASAATMFDPDQGISLASQEQREFNAKLGPGIRRITKVTWYVNPDGAAHPGVFAALDFVGEYRSMHFYCGYLVLYRIGQGSYEIVREEQNEFRRGDHAPDPTELAAMRSGACRDG